MCPNLLSLGAIREEVNGTYNDFTQALHQVTNAFVINPDDIDRLADKIRDAKIELGENYARQVNERRIGSSGSSGKEVARAGGGGGGEGGGKVADHFVLTIEVPACCNEFLWNSTINKSRFPSVAQ